MAFGELTRVKRSLARSSVLVLMLLAGSTHAFAGSTLLSMQSEPGDYIGGGREYFFVPSDGMFTAHRNTNNGVSISFQTPTFSEWWYLDFAAPNGDLLAQSLYTNAFRYSFEDLTQPGLAVYGDGRGCNMLTGSFQVLEVVYGGRDEIAAFRAIFEQRCEGATAALRGEIRFDATVSIDLIAPSHVSVVEGDSLTFAVSAKDSGVRSVVLAAAGLPAGATFTDNGNNTAAFNWAPVAGQAGGYTVTFTADNLQGDTATVFTRISVLALPPANDDFDTPTEIPSLPFSATQNTSSATVAPDDPFCYGRDASVWFAWRAPATMRVEADTLGSGYDTTLGVFTGSRGSLAAVACNDNADVTTDSRVRFDAVAGVTYFFVVSAWGYPGQGGLLSFHVQEGPPPLSIAPSVFRFGTVSLTTGVAEVNGSISCSQPAFVWLFGQLRQEHANHLLTGYFSQFVPCNGTANWSATVYVTGAFFHGRATELLVAGPATVTASALAYDPDTGEFVHRDLAAQVTLRGSR